jgi:predicted membrane chloride channel (bestrophin family)
MIPVVTVVAFTFMGIEGIASEIEMPFGTDRSDLPLGMSLILDTWFNTHVPLKTATAGT